jgi:recombination protein RecA
MKFLSSDQHIHHKDGNRINNILSNLEIVSNSEHLKTHCKNERFKNNLNFVAVLDTILTISPVGIKRVFDIKMEAPFHNFIADKFVVHNSGKTTLALTAIASAQRQGAWVWYGDMEHSLDPDWAEKLGVNLDKLLISQPFCAEECLSLAEYAIGTGGIDIIVIDSVASLVPRAEINGDFGDMHMGLQARLMSQAMRKLTAVLSGSGCVAIFINQIRDKIGIRFGSPETTPGGRALKFYSSVRIDVRKTGIIGKKEDSSGIIVKMTVKKNKCAPPFKICETFLYYDEGFSFGMNALTTAANLGVVKKDGKSYSWKDLSLGVGKTDAAASIDSLSDEKKKEFYDEIIAAIKESGKIKKPRVDEEEKKEGDKEDANVSGESGNATEG